MPTPSACAAIATRPPSSAHIAIRKPSLGSPEQRFCADLDVGELEVHAPEPADAERVVGRRLD